MKLEKKKVYLILGVVLAILILGVCLTSCMSNKDNGQYETIGEGGNVAAEGMQALNQTISLSEILEAVKAETSKNLKGIDDAKANEMLELQVYAGLEKRVAIANDETEYTEIWLFKTSAKGQEIDLFRLFESRIKDLKNESSSNENVEELFADPKNTLFKMQDNIVIMVASNKASQIENVIDEKMLEKSASVFDTEVEASVNTKVTMEDSVKVEVTTSEEANTVTAYSWDQNEVVLEYEDIELSEAEYIENIATIDPEFEKKIRENFEREGFSGDELEILVADEKEREMKRQKEKEDEAKLRKEEERQEKIIGKLSKEELLYNQELGKYEGEIELISHGKITSSVVVYDNEGNAKYERLGEITRTTNGIVDVKTERLENGNISVEIDAVEGGEIYISTTNEEPGENAIWQKYRAGETYTVEDETNEVSEVYVYYRAGTTVTEPGFAPVESVSWVTGMTYTYTDLYGTFTYVLDSTGKYARITLCEPTGTEVVFPTNIGEYIVLSIENTNSSYNIFGTNSTYTEVTNISLPRNLQTIGKKAFSSCSGFTGNLVIPNSVTSIGEYAFRNCSGFTGSLIIPNSVTSIGEYAFYDCSGFTGSLTIGNSVTGIRNYAFNGCSGFTGSLTIPNSVTYIGNHAFNGCDGFTGSLTIPNSVIRIGEYAFYGCDGFTGSLIIGNSVKYIEYYAFRDCSGFTGSLTIGNSVTSIEDYAFEGCSGFTGSLTIPNSVTSIGTGAFKECSSFTGILTIGNGVTWIGENAFDNCYGLNYIEVGNENSNYKDIDGILFNMSGNWLIKAPAGMIRNNYSVPEGTKTIGYYAFSNCSGFTGSLTIPNSVTSIGSFAFNGCSGFTGSLTIPNSVTSIGSNAFNGCDGFTGSLIIGNSVTSIGSNAFNGCSGFTGSLTIPNSVTSIGSNAFNGCSGLDYILLTQTETLPTNSNSSYRIYDYKKLYALTQSMADEYNAVNYWNRENNGNGVYPVLRKAIIGTEYIAQGSNFEDIGLTVLELVNKNNLFNLVPKYTNTSTEEEFDNLDTSNLGTYSATYYLQMLNETTGKYEYVMKDGSTTTDSTNTDVLESVSRTIIVDNTNFEKVVSVNWVTGTTYTYTDTYGTFTYVLDSTGEYARITLCKPTEEKVIFPTYISEYRVLSIGNTNSRYNVFGTNSAYTEVTNISLPRGLQTIETRAFYYCSGFIGSLIIPNSVTSIEDYAFSRCSSFIGNLVIPNSVTSIGSRAFEGCSGFTGSLTIPNSVKVIGRGAFAGCEGLDYIEVDDTNSNYKDIDGILFNISGTELIQASARMIRNNYSIPEGTKSIGYYAFSNCSGFTGSLTIPNSVTSIGSLAFNGCSGFTGSLTIPNSVTSIGEYAFNGCSGFTGSLTIPNSVTSIGSNAFNGCDGFTGSLTIGNSVTSIGSFAFCDCSGFTGSLTIPNSVTSIGEYAFYGCSGFTGSLTIPNSVTSMGYSAFDGCKGFTGSLTLSNGLTMIGDSIFNGCDGFTGNLVIPNSVTSIGSRAFEGCKGFTGSLTIPNSVKGIGRGAFAGCEGLDYILLTRAKTVPTNSSSSGIYDHKKLYALTSDMATAYNAVSYWNEENKGDGVYPVLRKTVDVPELVTSGTSFEDSCVTVVGCKIDPTGIFRIEKTYQPNAVQTAANDDGVALISLEPSDTLDTSMLGTHTATYKLQMLNKETGEYEYVLTDGSTVATLGDTDTPEQVTREIVVVDEAPSVTGISATSLTSGKYPVGTEITFAVTWSKDITVSVAPTLEIKFGDSSDTKTATYISTTNNVSTYKYVTEETDLGELQLVAYKEGYVSDNYAQNWTASEITFDESIIICEPNYSDGTNIYMTLADAFEKAPSGSTIEVVNDVEEYETATVGNGKQYVLDLNGHTLEFAEDSGITVDGTLDIINSDADEVGELVNGSTTVPVIKVTETGSLRLGEDDGSVEADIIVKSEGTPIENDGSFEYFDGSVMGKDAPVSGDITAIADGYHMKITEDGEYKVLDLESNDTVIVKWNISANDGESEVYAGLRVIEGDGLSADTTYTLVVWGDGATKDYESHTELPWNEVYLSKIVNLDLQEGVTRYGNHLFSYLGYVTSVQMPNSLEEIGYLAFRNSGLTGTVTIPENVKVIGGNPFVITAISEIKVDSKNQNFEVVDNALYDINNETLITYPINGAATKVTVKDGTKKIGAYAFGYNNNLEEIILPEGLEVIYGGAFECVHELEKITIPSSVNVIGNYVFWNASNLQYVYMKSTNLLVDGTHCFIGIADDSIIYTESKAIANLFKYGVYYDSAKTEIYYPFAFSGDLPSVELERGETLTFTPEIIDGYISDDVSYQWYKDGVAIEGATAPTYTKTGFNTPDAGEYTLEIKSAMQENGEYYYTVTSNVATVTKVDHTAPESVTFSTEYNADGTATVTITSLDQDTGITSIAVNGEALDLINVTATTASAKIVLSEGGAYTVVVTDGAGNATDITANVLNAYEITYSANADNTVYGDTLKQIKVEGFDIAISENEFDRVGHTFQGWNTSAAGNGVAYAENEVYDDDANLSLFAIWQINTYTVKFYNDNGIDGNKLVSEKTYTYGEVIEVPEEQYKAGIELNSNTYRIFYHDDVWTPEKVNAAAHETPVTITASNKDNIVMVDSDVNYYATYTSRDFTKTTGSTIVNGPATIAGTTYGIVNDHGLVIIGNTSVAGSAPIISGDNTGIGAAIQNNGGAYLYYIGVLQGPLQYNP